jgi:hypothetical protein
MRVPELEKLEPLPIGLLTQLQVGHMIQASPWQLPLLLELPANCVIDLGR